ncbi:TVP38/TMEM64 family protein [Azospirillum rugosum]|uniref:TVP38/TMEM64 family protein n=1 Tax=Azospirillum rugosum TaxID=416170 RepID=UPI00360F5BEE
MTPLDRTKPSGMIPGLKVVIPAVGVAVLAFGVYLVWRRAEARGIDVFEVLSSVESLGAMIESWGAWGPVASMALMVLHSFVPFPAELLAVANGAVFGLLAGVAITWAGAMLGALSAFALARWMGHSLVRRLLGERKWRQMEAWANHGGAGGLLVARLIPVIAFNLINYGAGLAGVGWWRFTWTTAVGILPMTIASVAVGSHMIEAPLWVWGVAATVAIVVWLGYRIYRRRGAGGPSSPPTRTDNEGRGLEMQRQSLEEQVLDVFKRAMAEGRMEVAEHLLRALEGCECGEGAASPIDEAYASLARGAKS